MPVIVAANPKGGSGKSTSCLILATTLASQGVTVKIIDADPQRTLGRWSEGSSQYRDIVVEPSAGEDLTDLIDRLRSQVQFVIIDVQGTANQEIAAAMSRATLVLIPMRAKTADARVATRAIGLLRSQEKLFQRAIPHAIVFIANNPVIVTREEKEIRKNVIDAQIPYFETSLNERTAFSHMFAQNLSLEELSPSETNGLDGARANATAFAVEVVNTLRGKKESAA
jgi:chromosome partitioning protein